MLEVLPDDVDDVLKRLSGFETAVAEVYADCMPSEDAPRAQALYKQLAHEFLWEFANDFGKTD